VWRIAEFVLHHRKLVLALWALTLVAGVVCAGLTSKRLMLDFSLPGQPGTQGPGRSSVSSASGAAPPRSW